MTTLCLADLKRCQGGQPKAGVRGAVAVRPHFSPEFVGIDPKSNFQRLAEYKQKLATVEAA